MLARLGVWSFRNPRKVVAVWIGVVVVVFGAVFGIGAAFNATFDVPDSQTKRGFEALDEHFGGFGSGQSGSIVFRSEAGVDDPEVRAAMEAMFEQVAAFAGVIVTSPYAAAAPARSARTAGSRSRPSASRPTSTSPRPRSSGRSSRISRRSYRACRSRSAGRRSRSSRRPNRSSSASRSRSSC